MACLLLWVPPVPANLDRLPACAPPADDGTVRMWDLRTAACTHVLASKSEGPVPAVALVEEQVCWAGVAWATWMIGGWVP